MLGIAGGGTAYRMAVKTDPTKNVILFRICSSSKGLSPILHEIEWFFVARCCPQDLYYFRGPFLGMRWTCHGFQYNPYFCHFTRPYSPLKF